MEGSSMMERGTDSNSDSNVYARKYVCMYKRSWEKSRRGSKGPGRVESRECGVWIVVRKGGGKDRSGTWGGRNETGGTRAVVGMGKEGEGEGKAGRTKWGLVIGVTVGFRGLKAAESSVRVGHTTAEKGSSRLANGSSVSVGRNVY